MTVYESFIAVNDNSSTTIYQNNWTAQTFVIGSTGTNEDFYLQGIDLKGRAYSPGSCYFSIRETDNFLPSGVDLVCGSKADSELSSSISWINVDLGSTLLLKKDTRYAIIMRSPLADSMFSPLQMIIGNGYQGGIAYASITSGSTWSIRTFNVDFRVYGLSAGYKVCYDFSNSNNSFALKNLNSSNIILRG
jgi:hypothetical protein